VNTVLDDLKRSRDQLDGKASQKSVDTALLLGLGGLVLGIVSLILNLM
jgi:hypothetical protein